MMNNYLWFKSLNLIQVPQPPNLLVMLNIIIGLIFAVLLLSLLATTIQELIASFFSLRGRYLEDALKAMFDTDDKGNPANNLFQRFQDNPIMKMQSSRKRRFFKKRPPSYISFANFFTILHEFISPKNNKSIQQMIDGLPKGNFKSVINAFYQEAEKDEAIFRARVEIWFNDMMDRVGGWYKRTTQIILFFLGLGVAICLNANIFLMYERLASSPEDTQKIVAIAEDVAKQSSFIQEIERIRAKGTDSLPTPISQQATYDKFNELINQTDTLINHNIASISNPLGLGWKSYSNPDGSVNIWSEIKNHGLLKTLVGWLIIALAISLGAPFWFDILKWVMNIRNTGSTPIVNRPTANLTTVPTISRENNVEQNATSSALDTHNTRVVKPDG